MGEMFNFIFDGLNERFGHELMLISQQYPFEPLKYLRPPLRITFQEGITLLRVNTILSSVYIIIFLIILLNRNLELMPHLMKISALHTRNFLEN